MTGPAIYRYFADMDSVFRSLVARNLERYLRALQQLLADPNIEWQDAVGKAVDIYAEMFRTEPGFARLRIGDALGSAVLSDEVSNARVVAAAAIRQFQPRYETWDRPMMTERIEVMVHVVFALVARAFECESAGDRFFIGEAKRLSVSYLEDFLASVPGTDPAAATATTPGA